MRFDLDGWDPAYGTAMEVAQDDPDDRAPVGHSVGQCRPDVERPAADWKPLDPDPGVPLPAVVLVVDGVRRTDANLWITDDNGAAHPGLVASYAAGVVRCDLVAGAAVLAESLVARGLFTASPSAESLCTGAVTYLLHQVRGTDPSGPVLAVQAAMADLERAVSDRARAGSPVEDDLLVVDGPLRGRGSLPRTVGYVKTHEKQYLPAHLTSVVTGLRPGQRCPVFGMGSRWPRYTWYVRLPGSTGSPWAGVVRLECSAELSVDEAVVLANRSALTLPRLASSAYKDPRAPQNLVPIAGLERRLRSLLGDTRLLQRSLAIAAAKSRQSP